MGSRTGLPRLYILCGLPFAGKTTLARQLSTHFGFVRVDVDEIKAKSLWHQFTDHYIPRPVAKFIKKSYPAINSFFNIPLGPAEQSYSRVESLLRQGQTVVSDTANFSRGMRDKLRLVAAKNGSMAKVIYVNTPKSVAKRRLMKNKKTQERFDVPVEHLMEIGRKFEAPKTTEKVVIYNHTTSTNRWIKQFAAREMV